MHYSLIAATFGIIFLAELPDKTMISSVIMGSKLVPQRVFIGASLAFLLQVILAVTVGGLVARVPRRPLDLTVGFVFLIGAGLILREILKNTVQEEESLAKSASREGFLPQVLLAFGVTFIGEFGDLTQIATANLAAKTADPLSVGIGSYLGLLAITTLGIYFGSRVLSKVPIKAVQLLSILILTALGLFSITTAL